eukprot:2677547-Pleurochrysis_carterae.AAC.1
MHHAAVLRKRLQDSKREAWGRQERLRRAAALIQDQSTFPSSSCSSRVSDRVAPISTENASQAFFDPRLYMKNDFTSTDIELSTHAGQWQGQCERASGTADGCGRASGATDGCERASGGADGCERASGATDGCERASGAADGCERASGAADGCERA